LRDVNQWHQRLYQLNVKTNWAPAPIENFLYIEGKEETQRTYKIQQLLSDKELQLEGRYMKHCVASYVYSCMRGRCSIWSMIVHDVATRQAKRVVTIEVDRRRTVVQVRGRCNRFPGPKILEVIQKWAKEEGLKVAKWVYED